MAALNMCFRATRLNKPVCALIKDMSGFKYDFVCSATLRTLRAQQIFGRGVSSLSKGGAVFEVCPRSSHLRAVKHRHVNIENHHRRHVCGISVFCTNVRHYSAESSQGTRLTEEILKSRTAPNEQDQEKNQNKSDESGEKKKESWFSGKNAWKLGLLSLAGMGFVMIGNLLFMWGKLLVYRRCTVKHVCVGRDCRQTTILQNRLQYSCRHVVDGNPSRQLGAAANFGDRTYRQIWGPNVNNNIYILTHEYSSTGFE